MDGTKRFSFQLSLAWRTLFLANVLVCFLFVAGALATGDPFVMLTSIAFFGFGGFVVMKIMLRNSGSIELREDGLLLDCYLCTGFIPWENLQSPQALRTLGTSYLGLSTSDPQAYVNSRKQLRGLKHEGDRVLGQGFMRVMMALLTVIPASRTACSAAFSVFGFAPLPKRSDEASLMEWNRESYGSQIIIHKMWLPEFDALLRELQTRVRANEDVPTLQDVPGNTTHLRLDTASGDAAVVPTVKSCPMCAEQVQAAAKICRYCRYSFDEDRLLPAAS